MASINGICSRLLAIQRLYRLATALQAKHRLFSSSTVKLADQWQLVSAACVERFPVITQPLTPLEQQYQKMLEQMELEESLLSDHELHLRDDEIRMKKRKETEEDADSSLVTTLDKEDAWEAEAKHFIPADRITEADKTKNMRSADRRLDSKLVLLVKQKLGNKTLWVLPQGPHLHGESMRQTAERVLKSLCGGSLNTLTMGNAPCAYFKYKFPEGSDHTGAKVFFFKMDYRGGSVQLSKSDEVSDYMWVAKDELRNYVPEDYLKCLKKFIIEL